jgi:DNA-binding IclR family transcriptional regulator
MLPARRAWRLLFALQGQTFDGLRLTQIAKALECSPTVALRLLAAGLDEGMVERIPEREECWRLSPRIVQIAKSHENEVDKLGRRLSEIDRRYTRDINGD